MSNDRILIAIPEDEHESLLLRAAWADALEAAGVESWEGFEHAQDMYRQTLAESIIDIPTEGITCLQGEENE